MGNCSCMNAEKPKKQHENSPLEKPRSVDMSQGWAPEIQTEDVIPTN